MALLVVEDDPAISRPLIRALEREGFVVDHVESGEAAILRASDDGVDLVLLDLTLPDIDGLEVCRRVRAARPLLPVVMLTARGEEVDLVVGFDAGADDYVTKPFRVAELVARLRARLRTAPASAPTGDPGGQLTTAGVRVDFDAHRAWAGDQELDLTPKEFDLLALLVGEAGKTLRRQHIMAAVWDEHWWGSTRTLDMHVSSLRRKLGDDPTHPRLITTVRGVGFRFEAAAAEPG
jgi:DNA-binding response OmpR family regulator